MSSSGDGETARVASALRERIIDGRLAGGQRLVERAIAADLGVSRLPVRHALKILSGEGLVDQRTGGGFRVHAVTIREVADLAEVLPAFDVLANRQAALRRTSAELVGLRRAADACIDAVHGGDATALHEAGLAFRRDVYRASRNRALIDMNRALDSRLRRLVLPAADGEHSIALYNGTYGAIEAGDPDAAASVLQQFLSAFQTSNRQRMLDAMDDGEPAESAVSFRSEAPGGTLTEPLEPDDAASAFAPESARVLARIREQIIGGERKPGDALSERHLSAEFDVSRIPVSEAIDALIAEGLAAPGISRASARVRGLTPRESADLVDVSATLDAVAVRLAAQRAAASDIALLEEILHAQHVIVETDGPAALVDSIFDFRRRLHLMSGNALVLVADSIINARLRMLSHSVPVDATPLRAERLAIDALITRDSVLADAVIRNFAAGPARRILETQG